MAFTNIPQSFRLAATSLACTAMLSPAQALAQQTETCSIWPSEVYERGVLVNRSGIDNQVQAQSTGVRIGEHKILTVAHGLKPQLSTTVIYDNESYGAVVERVDQENDMAILNAPSIPSINRINVAESVPPPGTPLIFHSLVYQMDMNLTVLQPWQGSNHVIYHPAIKQGDSGGGVYDCQGRLVSINLMQSYNKKKEQAIDSIGGNTKIIAQFINAPKPPVYSISVRFNKFGRNSQER